MPVRIDGKDGTDHDYGDSHGDVAKVGRELDVKRKNVLNICREFQVSRAVALGPVDKEWCKDSNSNDDDGCDSVRR